MWLIQDKEIYEILLSSGGLVLLWMFFPQVNCTCLNTRIIIWLCVIHLGKYWQSAGPCLRSSAADHSVLSAAEKTHRESRRHRWHWPNHTPPTAASETNQNLRANTEQRVRKQRDKLSVVCLNSKGSLPRSIWSNIQILKILSNLIWQKYSWSLSQQCNQITFWKYCYVTKHSHCWLHFCNVLMLHRQWKK